MYDFNVIPLYPKENDNNELNLFLDTSKTINLCADQLIENLSKFGDKFRTSYRPFCLLIRSTEANAYVKSTNFYIDHNFSDPTSQSVSFDKMLGNEASEEYQANYLSASIDVNYSENSNVVISIKGKVGDGQFKAEITRVYEDLLPYYIEEIECQNEDGTVVRIQLVIMSITHLTLCADSGLFILSNTLDDWDRNILTLSSFKTGWNNYFGMMKYIPPRKAALFDRSKLSFNENEDKIREVLESINSMDFNVLMFSFSLFSICKSLFSRRSYTPFLLNLNIIKSIPRSKRAVEAEANRLEIVGRKIYHVEEFYGESEFNRKNICNIPYCFFTPERCTNNMNRNLFALDTPFSAAATYERMDKADNKYFNKASFKDFPVVLYGSNKIDAYKEHIFKCAYGKFAYLYLEPRTIPDNLVDNYLRSPLSYILIDAHFSNEKASEILNFELDTLEIPCENDLPEKFNYWLSRLICSFIFYIENKLFISSEDLTNSVSKKRRLAQKILDIDSNVFENKFKIFLEELYEDMKSFSSGIKVFFR